MSKEAMKLALKKIKAARDCHPNAVDTLLFEAEEILEEALAEQPAQQEPVAWRAPNWGHGADEWVYRDFDDPVLIAIGKPSPNNEALYTSPPAQRTWVGLTDVEAQKAFQEHNCVISTDLAGILTRAIEAKLKEKNT